MDFAYLFHHGLSIQLGSYSLLKPEGLFFYLLPGKSDLTSGFSFVKALLVIAAEMLLRLNRKSR